MPDENKKRKFFFSLSKKRAANSGTHIPKGFGDNRKFRGRGSSPARAWLGNWNPRKVFSGVLGWPGARRAAAPAAWHKWGTVEWRIRIDEKAERLKRDRKVDESEMGGIY